VGVSDVKILRLSDNAQLPSRGFDDDAGFDLYVSQKMVVDPGKWADVPIGIAIEAPAGVWFRIVGRSSTFRSRRLLVIEGIIDHGYRGELFVGVTNLGEAPAYIDVGERLAQMIPHYNFPYVIPQWTDELSPHARGDNGFGSTGL
jgi:dUTP pyrophosphatase